MIDRNDVITSLWFFESYCVFICAYYYLSCLSIYWYYSFVLLLYLYCLDMCQSFIEQCFSPFPQATIIVSDRQLMRRCVFGNQVALASLSDKVLGRGRRDFSSECQQILTKTQWQHKCVTACLQWTRPSIDLTSGYKDKSTHEWIENGCWWSLYPGYGPCLGKHPQCDWWMVDLASSIR